jgi:hypothetical protein
MNDPTSQALLSALRSILIALGGLLTAKGYVDNATVQTIIGAVMVIAPAAWGVVDKVLAERKTQAREATAVNAGIQAADATPGPTPAASPAVAQMIIAAAVPPAPPPTDSTTKVAT